MSRTNCPECGDAPHAGACEPPSPCCAAHEQAYTELVEALRTVNELCNIGDAIYEVRERAATGEEGAAQPGVSSWDLPSVKRYNEACKVIEAALAVK